MTFPLPAADMFLRIFPKAEKMPSKFCRRHALAIVAWMLLSASSVKAEEPPVIAAASDLQFVLEEIVADFQAETGHEIRLSFGSTGNFARQIREGAPFQVFLAADESFVADLHTEGLTKDEGALYALGRLVIIVPPNATFKADSNLNELAAKLADGSLVRFAIANPDHAPYGARAKEALISRGLWDQIEPKLVLGENVSQAAQFALSGNAEGGIIAYSLALAPDLADRGTYALLPEDWHEPLRQRMVLLREAGPVAEAFYAYMQTERARAKMSSYGFTLPQGE